VEEGCNPGRYVDSGAKRRVFAALDTARQDVGIVDATGLEPVAEILESLARSMDFKNRKS
jgi:hypothetical protein